MSRARIFAGTTAALVAAGVTAKVVSDRQRAGRVRRRVAEVPFGTIHSTPRSVITDDGIRLNVEVDEADSDVTVVFAHGWMCTLDTWHYQRAALRGKVRMVFYDHRSHGNSQRARASSISIERLAQDLATVIDETTPAGKVVLIGHSMGGMTIMALGKERPDLFDERIVGAVLVATGSRRLMRPSRYLHAVRPFLKRSSRLVDATRGLNTFRVIQRYALGPGAAEKHVSMTEEMILSNPSYVTLDFYPMLLDLDVYDHLGVLSTIKTVILGGGKDLLTTIKRSREMHDAIDGSELIEFPELGHMLMFEDHEAVTTALEKLL